MGASRGLCFRIGCLSSVEWAKSGGSFPLSGSSGTSVRRAVPFLSKPVSSSRWDFLKHLITTAYGAGLLALMGGIEVLVIVSVNHCSQYIFSKPLLGDITSGFHADSWFSMQGGSGFIALKMVVVDCCLIWRNNDGCKRAVWWSRCLRGRPIIHSASSKCARWSDYSTNTCTFCLKRP